MRIAAILLLALCPPFPQTPQSSAPGTSWLLKFQGSDKTLTPDELDRRSAFEE